MSSFRASLPISSSTTTPRPTPNRTLRQPFTLDVADRESKSQNAFASGSHSGTSVNIPSDQETLRKTLNRKVELQRKTERWMDVLMEDTVDRATFKKAVRCIPVERLLHWNPTNEVNGIVHSLSIYNFINTLKSYTRGI